MKITLTAKTIANVVRLVALSGISRRRVLGTGPLTGILT